MYIVRVRYPSDDLVRCLVEDRKLAFVSGPRQVGKTTLVRSLLGPGGAYFNWDVDAHRRQIVRLGADFWRDRAVAGARTRLVLDEIHKYPRFKRFLKGLFDEYRDELEVLVTGSGRLDLYQRGGDSLFGRYALHRLHPFTVGELLGAGAARPPTPEELIAIIDDPPAVAGAEEALARLERFTGFPEPLFAGDQRRLVRWRRSRRDLVLREDLRDLTRVRDVGMIDSLAILLPERVGLPLSVNALSEDLGVAYNSVRLWLDVLARLYFCFELRPYAGRLARTLRREAKLYLFDALDVESEGARFENLVALHLLKLRDAWNDRGDGDAELHYVRDKEKREVDFLLTLARRPFLLVETKLADGDPSPALEYFAARMKPQRAVQLVRHGRLRRGQTTVVLPASRLLAAL